MSALTTECRDLICFTHLGPWSPPPAERHVHEPEEWCHTDLVDLDSAAPEVHLARDHDDIEVVHHEDARLLDVFGGPVAVTSVASRMRDDIYGVRSISDFCSREVTYRSTSAARYCTPNTPPWFVALQLDASHPLMRSGQITKVTMKETRNALGAAASQTPLRVVRARGGKSKWRERAAADNKRSELVLVRQFHLVRRFGTLTSEEVKAEERPSPVCEVAKLPDPSGGKLHWFQLARVPVPGELELALVTHLHELRRDHGGREDKPHDGHPEVAGGGRRRRGVPEEVHGEEGGSAGQRVDNDDRGGGGGSLALLALPLRNIV